MKAAGEGRERMRVFGLTGGIGSGKSKASERFRELGFPVIDADRVGHEVIAPGGSAEAAVVEAFGPDILTEGRIDRKKLGSRVFSNHEELERLNAIVHPAIKEEIRRRLDDLAQRGHAVALIDAALLAEGGNIADDLDGLILMLADEETRIERLVRQRGLSREQALRRIAAQVPPETKIPLARWIIENNGTLDELRAKVDELANALREA